MNETNETPILDDDLDAAWADETPEAQEPEPPRPIRPQKLLRRQSRPQPRKSRKRNRQRQTSPSCSP